MPEIIATGAVVLLLRIGLMDWRQRRIANSDVLIIAVLAAVYFLLSGPFELTALAWRYPAAILLIMPGFFTGQVGAGDVKLLVALAPMWPPLELLLIFATGVFSVYIMMIFASALARRANPSPPAHDSARHALARGLPLGSALACGALYWFIYQVIRHA